MFQNSTLGPVVSDSSRDVTVTTSPRQQRMVVVGGGGVVVVVVVFQQAALCDTHTHTHLQSSHPAEGAE